MNATPMLDPQRLAELREMIASFPPRATGGVLVGALSDLLADRDYWVARAELSESKREVANDVLADVREVARRAADVVCGSSGREALDEARHALDRIVLLVDGDAETELQS